MRGFLEPQVLVEWLRPLDSTKRSGAQIPWGHLPGILMYHGIPDYQGYRVW